MGGKDVVGNSGLEGGKFAAGGACDWNDETRGLLIEGLRGGVRAGGAYD